MTFRETLTQKLEPLWRQGLESAFVQKLKNGTLSQESFSCYLEQDKIYLLAYCRLCGRAIANARTESELAVYFSILQLVCGTEFMTRAEYETSHYAVQPLTETQAYIDFLFSFKDDRSNDRIFLVLLNCMLSYDYIFRQILKEMRLDAPYYFFVKDYTSATYQEICSSWKAYLDEAYGELSAQEERDYVNLLQEASQYENDFWQAVYQGGQKI